MPTYEINPNNAGTIEIALSTDPPTTLVAYSCQIVDIMVEPTQNMSQSPGTYCAAPHETPGLSSWALVVSFVQDWGNTPSLSEFTFTNDGELCDFEFTSSNPDGVPSMQGKAFVTATAFGGDAGSVWQVTTQRWPLQAKPTLVPAV